MSKYVKQKQTNITFDEGNDLVKFGGIWNHNNLSLNDLKENLEAEKKRKRREQMSINLKND